MTLTFRARPHLDVRAVAEQLALDGIALAEEPVRHEAVVLPAQPAVGVAEEDYLMPGSRRAGLLRFGRAAIDSRDGRSIAGLFRTVTALTLRVTSLKLREAECQSRRSKSTAVPAGQRIVSPPPLPVPPCRRRRPVSA